VCLSITQVQNSYKTNDICSEEVKKSAIMSMRLSTGKEIRFKKRGDIHLRMLFCTVERVFFGSVQFSEFGYLNFQSNVRICRCRIITNSNKSKFSRNANIQILSINTQFPQLVCLQNSTTITSAKTCQGVTTQGHMACVSCNGRLHSLQEKKQPLERCSEKFRKIVTLGFSRKFRKMCFTVPG